MPKEYTPSEVKEIEDLAKELDDNAVKTCGGAEEMVAMVAAISAVVTQQLPLIVRAIGDSARVERREDHNLSAQLDVEKSKTKELAKALATERHLAEFATMLQFIMANAEKIREASAVLAELTERKPAEIATSLVAKIL